MTKRRIAGSVDEIRPNASPRVLGELSNDEQDSLAAQIAGLDLDLLGRLYRGEARPANWAELARRAEPPPAFQLGGATRITISLRKRARPARGPGGRRSGRGAGGRRARNAAGLRSSQGHVPDRAGLASRCFRSCSKRFWPAAERRGRRFRCT